MTSKNYNFKFDKRRENSTHFIVIDEAQDFLDRGLDLFINAFSGYKGTENNGNPRTA